MAKLLDVFGLALVAVMALGFVGAFQPAVQPGLSTVFWVCAGGALAIIMYRKMQKGRQEAREKEGGAGGNSGGGKGGGGRGPGR